MVPMKIDPTVEEALEGIKHFPQDANGKQVDLHRLLGSHNRCTQDEERPKIGQEKEDAIQNRLPYHSLWDGFLASIERISPSHSKALLSHCPWNGKGDGKQ
mmetsp:Transcript_73964/g.111424  ORF Transcript_73964/g.111424 Transcript_73964/m.111424 type:complete len:101 (+) Transcript_73964:475-777(+)